MVPSAEILGVSLAVACVAVLGAGFLVYRYVITRRKKPPPSPDYSAVGDFKPPSLFSWDSTTSISFHEESHNVQPKIKPHIGRQVSRDDVSIATATTTASESSRDSFRESYKSRRVRTLSETSSCSVDSSNFDTSSIGIQPELYTRKNAVLRQESSVATLGRLHIRLKYDFRTSDLVVHLIEAQDLQPYDTVHGLSDPFIKIQMEPPADSKIRQSSVKRATTNPLFNEYFKMPIGFDDLKDRQLGFYVYNFDRFSHNDLMGEVKLNFSTIDVSTVVEVWCDIEPSSQNEEGLGDLLVSLSYLPTAERLTLVVMKARALKLPRASNAKIDPVVRVTLLQDNKPIKKKKSSVCKSSSNPVWNEALVFNVPPASLDHVSLEIAVADHDLLGHSESLGVTVLGKGREGVGGAHWKEMTSNVRKAVAKWHTLH